MGVGGARSRAVVLLLLAICLVTGCTNEGRPRAQPSPEKSPSAQPITIASLGLSFELPPSFGVAESDEFLFLARSVYPPGLLTIEPDRPAVIGHEAEGDETLTSVTIVGVDAVVVSNAVLEGLPEELEARELLVANGDRSFTLIMSALEPELPRLWRRFIASVDIRKV